MLISHLCWDSETASVALGMAHALNQEEHLFHRSTHGRAGAWRVCAIERPTDFGGVVFLASEFK